MTNRLEKAKKAKPVAAPARRSRFNFFRGLVSEMRKVHWPTRQETLRLSLLVLVLCAIIGAILGTLDFGFTRLFTDVFLGG